VEKGSLFLPEGMDSTEVVEGEERVGLHFHLQLLLLLLLLLLLQLRVVLVSEFAMHSYLILRLGQRRGKEGGGVEEGNKDREEACGFHGV